MPLLWELVTMWVGLTKTGWPLCFFFFPCISWLAFSLSQHSTTQHKALTRSQHHSHAVPSLQNRELNRKPLLYKSPCLRCLFCDSDRKWALRTIGPCCITKYHRLGNTVEPTFSGFQHILKTSWDIQLHGLNNYWVLRPYIGRQSLLD